MKANAVWLMVSFILVACSSSKQLSYQNSPLIKADSDYSEYRIGEDWYKGQWRIAPEVAHDTLKVICYSPKESFEFKTDTDHIAFEIGANTTKSFYVEMDEDTYAHTVIQGVPFQANALSFENDRSSGYKMQFQDGKSAYLKDRSIFWL